MFWPRNAVLLLLLCALAGGCAAQDVEQNEGRSLGDVVHETSGKNIAHPSEQSDSKTAVDASTAKQENSGRTPAGDVDLVGLLMQHKYDELEQAAQRMRTNKTRTVGGIWQLFLFYDSVNGAIEQNLKVLGELQKWVQARPESVTAHVALAEAYVSLGFAARGGGSADTVSDAGWAALHAQAAIALEQANEAARLGRDPDIYYVLMEVALAEGWDQQRTRQVFEKAFAEDPGYYHTFRMYAYYLLPKWYGDGPEAEKLGEELYRRVGGKEGLFLYFEIATLVNCACGGDQPLEKMSWERVKQGYAALQELYGANNVDNNRFLYMAYAQHDKAAANSVTQKIAGWENTVWHNQESFEAARAWALTP